MNEQEAIEQLQCEYLATNGTETHARVRYHNEALDTAIAALKEVQEYHDTGHTLRMVQIEHRPALEVIQRFDSEKVFMYLDPPYLLETRAAKQYKHEMTDSDHEEMLQVITKSKAKMMLSGYPSDMYEEYLQGWKRMEFRGTAEHAGLRTEVVWMNYEPPGQISLF